MNLFQTGKFHFNSGIKSLWKINCDALTDDDIETLALIAFNILPYPFREVIGVPRGGLRLATAINWYASNNGSRLIVDDVLTTGASMEKMKKKIPDAIGLVIFARGPVPDWITPIFTHCSTEGERR